MRKELLIGCGRCRKKKLSHPVFPAWAGLVTLDLNPGHEPDIVHDLDHLPYPFAADTFDEIHAYDVLEHCGRQGDWRFFFAQWTEFWRILKPGGFFFAIAPSPKSAWAWGDPSHTRVISVESVAFLSQAEYERQVGVTPMSDFRHVYKADFTIAGASDDGTVCCLMLRANKENA